MSAQLELAQWRRTVQELYADVRAEPEPEQAHDRWRAGRDHLFGSHPQSPLGPDDPLRRSGLPYWPYDPRLRFVLALLPPSEPERRLELDTGDDGVTELVPVGRVELPAPVGGSLDAGGWSSTAAGSSCRSATAPRDPAATAAVGTCSTPRRAPTSAARRTRSWWT